MSVPVRPAAVHAVCAAAFVRPIRFGTTRLDPVHAVTWTVAVAESFPSGVTSGLVAVTVLVTVVAALNATR